MKWILGGLSLNLYAKCVALFDDIGFLVWLYVAKSENIPFVFRMTVLD